LSTENVNTSKKTIEKNKIKNPCPLRFRKWDMSEIRKIFHFLCPTLLDVYIKIVHNFEGESSKH